MHADNIVTQITPRTAETGQHTTLRPAAANTTIAHSAKEHEEGDLKTWFTRAIGETFFSHLVSAMRKTTSQPAYVHGGRGEEVFQGQLDQMLVERITEASAADFTEPMFELFQQRNVRLGSTGMQPTEVNTSLKGTTNGERQVNTDITDILSLPRR